jgi:hypothetical protein
MFFNIGSFAGKLENRQKEEKDWLAARMGRLLTPCNLQGTSGIIESVFDDSSREIF